MTDHPDLSIILPAHNESRRLDRCLSELMLMSAVWSYSVGPKMEILIIENGSSDDTEMIAWRWQHPPNNIHVLHCDQRGKGLAVRTGMLAAHGKYRYMADVDLSTPPYEIYNFINAMETYDLVIGSRELDRKLVKTSLRRRMVGRCFHLLASKLVPGIRDTQCGFKMFTAEAAEKIFSRAQVNGMAFDVEVLLIARQLGLRMKEIPVPWENDPDSRVSISDPAQMFYDLLRMYARHIPTNEKDQHHQGLRDKTLSRYQRSE